MRADQDPSDPFVVSRQVRQSDEIAKRHAEQFRVLRPARWYHTLWGVSLLCTPLLQYFGYLSTADARWFYYPLAVSVAGWTALNAVLPVRVALKLPLSWSGAGLVCGFGLFLALLLREPDSVLVVAYRAIAFDVLVITLAILTVNLITFARYSSTR